MNKAITVVIIPLSAFVKVFWMIISDKTCDNIKRTKSFNIFENIGKSNVLDHFHNFGI